MNAEKLFEDLFGTHTEDEVTKVLEPIEGKLGWKPYGDNESNFGVMEAQQANPVPALVEKLTNSIDAILMKRCLEEGIDPKSKEAPQSIEDAIKRFFPNAENWNTPRLRGSQAESLQIIAHGPRKDTSLVIYDDGEGQHPQDFEDTFLSLLRGNKAEIQFVQGKYNMGGAGAIVFCGKQKYQLVASKKYDNSGQFGFTLVRRHPLSSEEQKTRRSTWYEYLTINDQIPSFHISNIDLGLHGRQFTTGTVLKLYSYQLPPNSSPINRELNRSINEYLFEPALPVLIVEQANRYPKDRALSRSFYGLKRRLEEEDSQYIQDYFQQKYSDKEIGSFTATVYVFNAKTEDRSVKETRETIRREFFKNNMSVIFSLNGQVHAPFTSEFISRTLKYQLIKDYLLIHVDCTNLKIDFRNELFMASRDRAKSGEEMHKLRSILGNLLKDGPLKEIYKKRKDSISGHGEDTTDLLKNFSKNLPFNRELLSLLNQDFKLDRPTQKKSRPSGNKKKHETEESFNPQRFPSKFKIDTKASADSIPMVKIPKGGDRTIKFSTDVEDTFFDRVAEAGALHLGIAGPGNNQGGGGTQPGTKIEDVFSVNTSSPNKGTIRVKLKPDSEIQVGESFQIKATLSSKVKDFDEIFEVQIVEPEKQKQPTQKQEKEPEPMGLPEAIRVYKRETNNHATWASLEETGVEMDHSVVIKPLAEGDKLERIYINMDASVIKDYRSKLSSTEQIQLADNRYFSTVYFHTLFLYTIACKMDYQILRKTDTGETEETEIGDFISKLFSHHYSEFLLKFEMETLLESLSD